MAAIAVSSAKEYRKQLAALAARHDYEITRTKGGHLKLSKPGRPPIHAPSSASDPRSLKNVRSYILRNERTT